MDIRFAPMEGLTDAVYRRIHHRHFAGVDRYYMPFVSPTQEHVFTARELRGIAPENNQGVPVVPQVLARDAEHFLWAAGALRDMGYDEVNLNMGCPSGTVTAKGKGSGMLREPDATRAFLDAIFARSPLPVSVKTRIGFESAEEWPALLDMLSGYPLRELIIHPRVRRQFYKGMPDREAFALAARRDLPLVYNGDLFTAGDCLALQAEYPQMPMMLGRALVANPALAQELKGGEGLTHAALRDFHDELEDAYRSLYPRDQVHMRMRGVMKHVACCFERPEKMVKLVAKSNPWTYREAIDKLLQTPLRESPGFLP